MMEDLPHCVVQDCVPSGATAQKEENNFLWYFFQRRQPPLLVRVNSSQSELDLPLSKLNKSKIGKNNISVTDGQTDQPNNRPMDIHILIDSN